MAGVSYEALHHKAVALSLCKVLEDHIPENLVILNVEQVLEDHGMRRRLVFTYTKMNESITARQTGKKIPKYHLEIGTPVWTTHVNLQQIIAKFALVG